MKITENQLDDLFKAYGELNDGLYAIVSQGQYMVEMMRMVLNDGTEVWVVEEFTRDPKWDNYDMFTNSSFTITVDQSVRSHFNRDAVYKFDTREEAFKHFTDYQFVRNHF
jgi:hypothetical protein